MLFRSEGYDDSHKQLLRRFYASVADPGVAPEYPEFVDGLRQLAILKTELESHSTRRWIDVASTNSAPG